MEMAGGKNMAEERAASEGVAFQVVVISERSMRMILCVDVA